MAGLHCVHLSSILTLLCTATLGQDIVFQQRRPGFDALHSSGITPGALEFPASVAGSEVLLLRFGGSFNCRAPDRQLGRCGPLLACDVMRETLLPLTTARLRFLKRSICRIVGGKPLVCCPSKPPQLTPTTSAPLVFEDPRQPAEPPLSSPETPTTSPAGVSGGGPGLGSNRVISVESTAIPGMETAAGAAPSEPVTAASPAEGAIESTPSAGETATVTGQPPPSPVTEPPSTPEPTDAPAGFPTAVPEQLAEPPTERAGPVQPPGLDDCGYRLEQRITGGREAKPNSWPWLAALGYERDQGKVEFLCGGALITDQHILTAAHCIREQLKVVRMGDHDLTNATEVSTVSEHSLAETRPHEKYNNRTLFNDIAIIKLSSKVNFTEAVHPICLPLVPEMRNVNAVGKITFIAGWGTTSFKGEASPVLREAKVRVHRHQLCKQRYRALRHKLSEKQMCASAREGGANQDTCQGDSGGPMMMPGVITPNWYVMGVVSFGFRCGEPRFPGVYTRVTEYLDWVVDNLQ